MDFLRELDKLIQTLKAQIHVLVTGDGLHIPKDCDFCGKSPAIHILRDIEQFKQTLPLL